MKLNQARKTSRNVLTSSSAGGLGSSVTANSAGSGGSGSSLTGLNNSAGSGSVGSGLGLTSHGSGRKPLMSSSGNSQVARPVSFDDKTNSAICIRNLPMRGNGPSGKFIIYFFD